MSYLENSRRSNPATVAVVVAVHLAIGYAFVSGLAITVIRQLPTPTIARLIPDDVPPPPDLPQPEARADQPAAPTTSRTVPVDLPRVDPIVTVTPSPQVVIDLPALPAAPDVTPPPAPVSRARPPQPMSDRGGWVTTDDYPPSALRDGLTGTTAIRLAIGSNGRVTECVVTGSSGSALLDDTACRVYARRARFRPALDDAGTPVASTRADRIVWRIPG